MSICSFTIEGNMFPCLISEETDTEKSLKRLIHISNAGISDTKVHVTSTSLHFFAVKCKFLSLNHNIVVSIE